MATQASGSGGGDCSSYSSNKDPVSSVLLTLPITCQICLGKVKDPVICPNQHVFCGLCMTQWLNSNQICPTCRIPINESQPCKMIIGSLDCSHPSPDRDVKEQLRRTRFELLFQEYEGEIGSLETQLEQALADNKQLTKNVLDLNKKLEESEERFLRAINSGTSKEKVNGDTVSTDINTILKLSSKLQDLIQYNSRLKEENGNLKEEIKTLETEKNKLSEQVKKVVEENSFPRSPQKYGKYTLAAMQTKVENYEKEIQRLKRALDRSDEYIDQLNSELRGGESRRDVEMRNPPSSESTNHDSDRGEISGLSSNTSMSNGQASFPVRRQINLTVGKSPLNHVATAAFTPSSGVFMSVDEDKLPSLSVSCNGDLTVASSTQQKRESRESLPVNEAGQDVPPVFPGSSISLNSSDALPESKLGTEFRDNASSDSFADPVRFPACAKLIQLTKAHRLLSNPTNPKTRPGNDNATGPSTSPEATPFSASVTTSSAATVVVSPRNNLVDLLLQPRESARKERRTDSPDREGHANGMQKAYLSPSRSYKGENGSSVSPVNIEKTPSPPALISTVGEPSGAYDNNSKSPRLERSPPPLSYCGGYGRTNYPESSYVSTATVKNDPIESSRTGVEQPPENDEFAAFPLSPKRVKLEPQD